MNIRTMVAAAAIALSPLTASAATFIFGGSGSSETYTDTVDGITLSASAGLYSGSSILTEDADGVFTDGFVSRNLTFHGSGIGVGGFDTNGQVDGRGFDDLLTFYFSETVRMVSVRFRSVESDDDFDLFVDGSRVLNEQNISSQNPFTGVYTGDRFGFGADGRNDDFRIRSITVQAVPLPAGAVLLLSGLGLLALRRRKS